MENFAAAKKCCSIQLCTHLQFVYVHHVYSLFIMTKCLPTIFIYFCHGFQITIERAPIAVASAKEELCEQKKIR